MTPPPPTSTLFPYTTLFRSSSDAVPASELVITSTDSACRTVVHAPRTAPHTLVASVRKSPGRLLRSEEHTSELQSRRDLVCRLLLEKKKRKGISMSLK